MVYSGGAQQVGMMIFLVKCPGKLWVELYMDTIVKAMPWMDAKKCMLKKDSWTSPMGT